MRSLWVIKSDIVDRYKDGDDWVYAKGKKTEIELIKELMEVCTNYAQKVHELEKELEVLDKWEAYGDAEIELDRVRSAFGEMTKHFAKFEEAKRLKEDAMRQLSNAEQYMHEIAEQIANGEKADEPS